MQLCDTSNMQLSRCEKNATPVEDVVEGWAQSMSCSSCGLPDLANSLAFLFLIQISLWTEDGHARVFVQSSNLKHRGYTPEVIVS